MNKEDILKILEGAKDKNGDVPMRLVRLAFKKLPESCTDTISRQAAIDAVKKNTFRLTFAEEQNCEGHVAWSAETVYSDVMEGELLELPSAHPLVLHCTDCEDWHTKQGFWGISVSDLPSAQPEPQWIPVTKKAHPDLPIRVQVQLDNGWIITAYYQEGEWLSVPDVGEPLKDEWIEAWRELPEPYEERREDGQT